jgi:AcrR family transcriptional regulator
MRPVAGPLQSGAAADGTTRGRLLDAAAEVFCERGYQGTTVAEVARRAGLTTGAIYANFRDKADLLLQAIDRDSAGVVAEMEAARHAGVSAADRLLLMARGLVAEAGRPDRPLFVEMFAAARRDPDVGRRVAGALGAMESELARLLERACGDGDVAPEWDCATLARFCLALGVGFTHLAVAGLANPDLAQWSALSERLLAALRPDTSPRGTGPRDSD